MRYMMHKKPLRVVDSKKWKCSVCNKRFEYSDVIEFGDGVVCCECANMSNEMMWQ